MRVNLKGRSRVNSNLLTFIEAGIDEMGKDCLRISDISGRGQSISYDHESDRDIVYKNLLGTKDTKPFQGLGNRA